MEHPVTVLVSSGKVLKRRWWLQESLHSGMLGGSRTHCPAVRDGSEEKQEADREALRARILWKPRLGRHEQRQERKGPLILRGATELACLFQAPDCCFTA